MNWLAIIVSAVAAMLLGFGWYSQWAFGKSWASLTGRTMGGKGKRDAGFIERAWTKPPPAQPRSPPRAAAMASWPPEPRVWSM